MDSTALSAEETLPTPPLGGGGKPPGRLEAFSWGGGWLRLILFDDGEELKRWQRVRGSRLLGGLEEVGSVLAAFGRSNQRELVLITAVFCEGSREESYERAPAAMGELEELLEGVGGDFSWWVLEPHRRTEGTFGGNPDRLRSIRW